MSQKPPVITMHSGNDKRLVRKCTRIPGFSTATQHCTLTLNFTRAIRKEIKITQARKVEVKLYLFADEVILCIETIQDSIRKLLVLIN